MCLEYIEDLNACCGESATPTIGSRIAIVKRGNSKSGVRREPSLKDENVLRSLYGRYNRNPDATVCDTNDTGV